MITWLRHHRQALGAAFRKWAAQRSAGLLHALVLGVALSLPAGGYALLDALRGIAGRGALEPQVSLFLEVGATAADASRIEAQLRQEPRVAGVRFIPRAEALASLGRNEGIGDVVAALGRNPLPDAFVVRAREPAGIDRLAGELGAIPGVAHVQLDALWARRLAALDGIGRLAVALLGALLGVGLVATTFNTIRLQILVQREEIEVSKLIGATDPFIQRPFLYLGSLQGLGGGAVALAIVWGAVGALDMEIAPLAGSYGSNFRLVPLGGQEALALSLVAAALGWFGAYLSVSRYLRQIEPK